MDILDMFDDKAISAGVESIIKESINFIKFMVNKVKNKEDKEVENPIDESLAQTIKNGKEILKDPLKYKVTLDNGLKYLEDFTSGVLNMVYERMPDMKFNRAQYKKFKEFIFNRLRQYMIDVWICNSEKYKAFKEKYEKKVPIDIYYDAFKKHLMENCYAEIESDFKEDNPLASDEQVKEAIAKKIEYIVYSSEDSIRLRSDYKELLNKTFNNTYSSIGICTFDVLMENKKMAYKNFDKVYKQTVKEIKKQTKS